MSARKRDGWMAKDKVSLTESVGSDMDLYRSNDRCMSQWRVLTSIIKR